MKKDKFIPLPIYFDEQGFKAKEKLATEKLEVLNKALEWCSNHIDTDKLDRVKFIENMVKEFGFQLQKQKGNIVKTKISTNKLAFLLDIDDSELTGLESQYKNLDIDVQVSKDDYLCRVDKDDFIQYTKDLDENLILIRGNDFLKSLDLISQHTKIYPMNIQQGTNGLIQFDMRTNKYRVRVSANA